MTDPQHPTNAFQLGGPMRLVHVPDRILEQYREWQGTADELAALANRELKGKGLLDQDLNTRLVRYYSTMGLLDPPSRRGKEALFGVRQLMQLFVIRHLLQERLSLQQIRELISPIDWGEVTRAWGGIAQTPAPPVTEAERVVAALKSQSGSALGVQPLYSLQPTSGHAASPSLGQTLQRWELSPGCEVLADPAVVHQLSDDEINQLGNAFTAALQSCRNDHTNRSNP